MYGLNFILTIFLLFLIVLNLPFILFYLYFWLRSFFNFNKKANDLLKELQAVSKEHKPEHGGKEGLLLLFPFRLIIFILEFTLILRPFIFLISGLGISYFLARFFFAESQKAFNFLNWNTWDIFASILGVIILLIWIFNLMRTLRFSEAREGLKAEQGLRVK